MTKVPKDITERVRKLRETIEHHAKLYHTYDRPEISDEAYDALIRELEKIESTYPELVTPASPPPPRGGGGVLKNLKKKKKRKFTFSTPAPPPAPEGGGGGGDT